MALGLLDRINVTTTLDEFASVIGRYGIHKIEVLINPGDHHAYMILMRGVNTITIGTGVTLHAAIDDAVSRAMHLAGAAVQEAKADVNYPVSKTLRCGAPDTGAALPRFSEIRRLDPK